MRYPSREELIVVLKELCSDEKKCERDFCLLSAYRTFREMDEPYSATELMARYQLLLKRKSVGDFQNLRFEKVDETKLKVAFSLFRSYTLQEFLQYIVPDLIADLETTLSALERLNDATKISTILLIKSAPYMQANAQFSGTSQWDTYSKLVAFFVPDLVPMTQEDFERAYDSIYGFRLPFDAVERIEKSKEFHDALAVKNSFYALGLDGNIPCVIAEKWFCHGMQPQKIALDLFDDTAFKANAKAFQKAFEKMIKLNPYICLNGFQTNLNATDLPLLFGYLLPKFRQTFLKNPKENDIVIVNAPPAFIEKYTGDLALQEIKTTFVFSDKLERNLLHLYYKSGKFLNRNVENFSFESLVRWRKFLETENKKFNRILLFSENYSDLNDGFYMDILQRFGAENLLACALIPTYSFEIAAPFLCMLGEDLEMKTVDLLPQGIASAAVPRRKIFASYQKKNEPKNEVKTLRLRKLTLRVTATKTILEQRPEIEDVYVPLHQMMTVGSLRNVYRELSQSVQSDLRKQAVVAQFGGTVPDDMVFRFQKRNRPQAYDFCPEFPIWYTLSEDKKCKDGRHRITAYFCELLDEINDEIENPYRRGKMISSTKLTTTTVSDAQAEDWIEHTFAPKMRCNIIGLYQAFFKGKAISLKLLWYLHPEMQLRFQEDLRPILTELMQTRLGFLNVLDDANVFEETLEATYPKAKNERLNLLWEILFGVIAFAVEQGYSTKNQLEEQAIYYGKAERNLMAEIRNALVKRSFSVRELASLYKIIMEKIADDMAYLGVLMRLTTGLEPNILCALTWDDLQYIPEHDIYQLLIFRQITNDGLDEKALSSAQEHRRIPCIPLLADCLQKQKVVVQNTCFQGTALGAMKSMPIITTLGNLEDDTLRYRKYPPMELEKRSKEVLQVLHIPDQIIQIPDTQKGTKETNLNRYQGDIFRSNLRFYLQEKAEPVVDIDEMMYLLGNTCVTTFARNYYDFEQELSQFLLWEKLLVWNGILQNRGDS